MDLKSKKILKKRQSFLELHLGNDFSIDLTKKSLLLYTKAQNMLFRKNDGKSSSKPNVAGASGQALQDRESE